VKISDNLSQLFGVSREHRSAARAKASTKKAASKWRHGYRAPGSSSPLHAQPGGLPHVEVVAMQLSPHALPVVQTRQHADASLPQPATSASTTINTQRMSAIVHATVTVARGRIIAPDISSFGVGSNRHDPPN
jgi:hypothetical protein